jgi:predicted RNA binding protein YcfA (HicA-like mRNA interferase family)
MKRKDLIYHLERNGCEFLREGGSHTVYVNRAAQKSLECSEASRDKRFSGAA